MNLNPPRNIVKGLLGFFPRSSKFFQALRPETIPSGSFRMSRLEEDLSGWAAAAQAIDPWTPQDDRKSVLIVGCLKWWFEYSIALGLMLNAAGHKVDLAYLPYRDWTTPVPRFDALRGVHYIAQRTGNFHLPLNLHSLMAGSQKPLSSQLEQEIAAQSHLDVQYTMQREDVDVVRDSADSAMYRLRLARNRLAAASARDLLIEGNYDVVIIPNGSILEFGAIYRTAKHLGIETVTYEFGEQRERVWLAQNDEVMRQNTAGLWQAVKDMPLKPSERLRIEKLFQARRGGQTWEQFNRQWQSGGSEGAQRARAKLGLDAERPLALLCTNVVGDSLALDRQVFTHGMADWLSRTVTEFSHMPEYQLVVRVHPGEMLGAGHPSADIVKRAVPEQPGHVIVVPPESDVNTYDLIELAQVGLVYTTTVGLEMSMHGVPVIVAGATHYKGKGFTEDPSSWDEYVSLLQRRLAGEAGHNLSDDKIERAWRYAYRFFFDYPFEFPWHLISFWEDIAQRPFTVVLDNLSRGKYLETLQAFVGCPINWTSKAIDDVPLEVPIES